MYDVKVQPLGISVSKNDLPNGDRVVRRVTNWDAALEAIRMLTLEYLPEYREIGWRRQRDDGLWESYVHVLWDADAAQVYYGAKWKGADRRNHRGNSLANSTEQLEIFNGTEEM